MHINDLSRNNSIIGQFIHELRDREIQSDRMRFRRNMERLGEVFAYEISKTLPYKSIEVTTPLGISEVSVPSVQPVVATILRAGLPLHHGILNYFDNSDNAFISAFRKHHKDGSFDIKLEYVACPDLDGRFVIISDPMLATGRSMVLSYRSLLEKGKPSKVHIVSALASTEGIDHLKKHLPSDIEFWVGAIDDELTAQAYIVPGLGDAGDLAFGSKQ
jgi:uracil phosphoribosyltransferase